MPTHYRGSAQERAGLDAYIKLMRAADSVTARLDPLMRAADLTFGQFGALEALLHRGPLCQRDLGRKLLRSGGNISEVGRNPPRRGLRARPPGAQEPPFVARQPPEQRPPRGRGAFSLPPSPRRVRPTGGFPP